VGIFSRCDSQKAGLRNPWFHLVVELRRDVFQQRRTLEPQRRLLHIVATITSGKHFWRIQHLKGVFDLDKAFWWLEMACGQKSSHTT
jgi:hypothetical protein